ncbi:MULTISPECIES: LacI family DNA-binding transcriptional regulator [Pseudomonas]|jgi:LacI family transcriptional regulator|uniref:LacI family DNA-binding transcriptional regulator n=1 Tax=Pseudomonas putida TaxID=303 RepID=A0A379KKK9_PSEPU|nr:MULTISPECIES: LacI family DNA-binding transcriptional regulator [Pseudomonas]QPN44249.1 LacI family DNA-binding transcriptional regulator [Priestia aryabhattai]KAF1309535.1 LacI family transcriptional regulator [Pseudomonas sp. SG-MS2]MBG6126718.1 LacI family transcriptional regulator [Pseudomonas sp. M2]MBM7397300.1 LacI family transcriptional regulator [Pseudomonas sp. M5]NSX22285.1 LacI family DNA-binding transcriptional regulator [Pseudomonas putida]
MTRPGKATITDIAKRVNMTTVTVSRALNQPEKVKKQTLELILKVAKELNYVPNAFARNLKNRESRLLGLVTASLENPFYGEIIKAITREAKKRDYTLMLFDTDGSPELEARAIDTLLSYQVAGVILSVISDDDQYQPSYLAKLEMAAIPVVQIDRQLTGAPFAGVYLDNEQSGYQGARALLAQGRRRLLVVAGPQRSKISLARLAGIRRALEQWPEPTVLEVVHGDYTQAPARDVVRSYLQSGKWPDVIFGLNALMTLGALQAMREVGLSRNDIALFSIDQVHYAEIYGQPIPCISHSSVELGVGAINLLLGQIDDPSQPLRDQVIEGQLLL